MCPAQVTQHKALSDAHLPEEYTQSAMMLTFFVDMDI